MGTENAKPAQALSAYGFFKRNTFSRFSIHRMKGVRAGHSPSKLTSLRPTTFCLDCCMFQWCLTVTTRVLCDGFMCVSASVGLDCDSC